MKRGQFLTTNKKGISDILATLMIILLVLVAVGIIWVVLRNVVGSGTEQVEISSKCLSVDLRIDTAPFVTNPATDNTTYTVTIRRAGSGDPGAGVKVNLFNATTNAGVRDFGMTLDPLDTKTNTSIKGVLNANKIEYTPYFVDSTGKELLCGNTRTLNF